MHKQPFVTPYTLNLVLTGSDFLHRPSFKYQVAGRVRQVVAHYRYFSNIDLIRARKSGR